MYRLNWHCDSVLLHCEACIMSTCYCMAVTLLPLLLLIVRSIYSATGHTHCVVIISHTCLQGATEKGKKAAKKRTGKAAKEAAEV
jgi:hypothetical protein